MPHERRLAADTELRADLGPPRAAGVRFGGQRALDPVEGLAEVDDEAEAAERDVALTADAGEEILEVDAADPPAKPRRATSGPNGRCPPTDGDCPRKRG
jgi:hypothetical protein